MGEKLRASCKEDDLKFPTLDARPQRRRFKSSKEISKPDSHHLTPGKLQTG